MPLGQYKGIDINEGDQASIQAQMKAIDDGAIGGGASSGGSTTETKPEPTLGDILGDYTGGSQNDIYNSDDIYRNLAKTGSPLSAKDEKGIRSNVISQFQGEINAAKDAYASLLRDTKTQGVGRLGENTALNARSGLIGSDFGNATTEKTRSYNLGQEKGVLESQANAIANIMSRANTAANAEIASRRAAKTGGYESYNEYLTKSEERKDSTVKKIASNFILNGLNPAEYKNDLEAMVKQLNKAGVKVTTRDILNSYLEQDNEIKAAEADKLAKANAPFELSEGQARYVYNPETGEYEKTAFNPKTYAPKAGDGSGTGTGAGLDGFPPDIQAAAQSILDGKSKLNEYPSGKRLQINQAMSKVYTAAGGNELAQGAYDAIESLESHGGFKGAVGAKGISSFFGLKGEPIAGTEAAGFKADLDRLKANLKLVNIKYLKGTGALSDAEGKTLEDAGTSLNLNLPEKQFKTELARVKAILQKANNLVVPESENIITAPDGTEVIITE